MRYLPEQRKPNWFETFICGPVPMMKAVEKSLTELGVTWAIITQNGLTWFEEDICAIELLHG
jgi:ferredoxin-NADP reductase